jgi:hypothetical protein
VLRDNAEGKKKREENIKFSCVLSLIISVSEEAVKVFFIT